MNRNEYRKFADWSEKRALWLFNGVLFSCLLLILGPCSVKSDGTAMRYGVLAPNRSSAYGDSVNWSGMMPRDDQCYFGQCPL